MEVEEQIVESSFKRRRTGMNYIASGDSIPDDIASKVEFAEFPTPEDLPLSLVFELKSLCRSCNRAVSFSDIVCQACYCINPQLLTEVQKSQMHLTFSGNTQLWYFRLCSILTLQLLTYPTENLKIIYSIWLNLKP